MHFVRSEIVGSMKIDGDYSLYNIGYLEEVAEAIESAESKDSNFSGDQWSEWFFDIIDIIEDGTIEKEDAIDWLDEHGQVAPDGELSDYAWWTEMITDDIVFVSREALERANKEAIAWVAELLVYV